MSRLLSANFLRLKKSKIFWLSMIFMFGCGLYIPINKYLEDKRWYALDPLFGGTSLEYILFYYSIVIGVVCAVFSSLFLGTEYSNGTIRNKLVVGKSRTAIYFSNLIINITVSLLMLICYLTSIFSAGIPLLGTIQTDLKVVIEIFLASLVTTIAFSSIFTLISMINQNKAAVCIISVAGVFVFLLISVFISQQLTSYKLETVPKNGDTAITVASEETELVTGSIRDVFEFLDDFLPTSQALRYAELADVNKLTANELNAIDAGYEIEEKEGDYLTDDFWHLPLYSGIIAIVTTGIGVFIFRKKDIK